ncbi:MAG: alpha/beta hydrolase [Deltaproteobacteria bacterium]|nr:alpha/beta hydrolase [Deltaproteobacteria bacterium]
MVNRILTGVLAFVLLVTLGGCAATGSLEGVLPATVDRDARLPRTRIRVAGADRWIHWRVVGREGAPVLLVLHGSLGDHRALLPLAQLADRYRVVLWDQRGNGLSERIPEKEYTEASIVEEIDAVADQVAPGAPVTLVGHSFGAMYTSLYLSVRPERVRQAVFIEPGGLDGDIFTRTFDDVINVHLFDSELNAMFWQAEQIGPVDHESSDYRALLILQNGKQTNYHCDSAHPPAWPVWRPGAAVDVYRGRLLGASAGSTTFSFDFARGARAYPRPVLFVAGTCSALGPEYQRRWHAPLFREASVVAVPNTGHRLVQEDPNALLAALRAYLEAYRAP